MLERRRLCAGGPLVTVLGFGALEIGRNWGIGDAGARERPGSEAAAAVLHAVLDAGINLIDTASAYHQSEARIGQVLAGRRQEFVLASKCGEHNREPGTYYDFSYEAIRDSIDRSLELLRTDVIDLMQIHFGPDPEGVLDAGETVRAMRGAQEAGKVRYLGASAPNRLAERCVRSGDFQVLQLEYNLLQRGVEPAIDRAAEQGVGVVLRGPLAGGWLTPRARDGFGVKPEMRQRLQPYIDLVDGDLDRLPSLAMAFVRRNPGVCSILAGSKSLEHLRTNVAAFSAGLPPELVAAAAAVRP